jgi:hypothetical protein
MRDNDQSVLEVLEIAAKRREERRRFIKFAGGATVMAGGLTLLSACGDDDDDSPTPTPSPTATPTPTPPTGTTPPTEVDVLNFALQLEYLEANFYSYAAFGVGLDAGSTTGAGTQGAVQLPTGAGRPRAVDFGGDTAVQQYAREIAQDELSHIRFLRGAIGGAVTAQPAINISGDATGAFTAAARSAGVVGPTGTFDPYADANSFLLGAFLFADVGPTAYMGGVPLLTTAAVVEAAAGLHAVEAYHAGLIRTLLYRRGATLADLRTNAGRISDARDTLDGTANTGLLNQGGDRDQGLTGNTTSTAGNNTGTASNLVPTDPNGIVFVRSPGQVLNIVYLTPGTTATSGGFFPAGVNGTIRSTAA